MVIIEELLDTHLINNITIYQVIKYKPCKKANLYKQWYRKFKRRKRFIQN